MIIELDTSLLDKLNISASQLILLTLVLDDIKIINQDIQRLLSLVNEEEIQELVNRDLISITMNGETKVINKTAKLEELLKEDRTIFDAFYDQFPVYVTRPDGTKGFLRSNINKCRKEYNRIVGKSKAMHEHLLKCLQYEIENKMSTGKMGYMKTMWKWLTQHEWEALEEQMLTDEPNNTTFYGDIL